MQDGAFDHLSTAERLGLLLRGIDIQADQADLDALIQEQATAIQLGIVPIAVKEYQVIADYAPTREENNEMYALIALTDQAGNRQLVECFTPLSTDRPTGFLARQLPENLIKSFFLSHAALMGQDDEASTEMLKALDIQAQRVLSWLGTGQPALNSAELPTLYTDEKQMIAQHGVDWFAEFEAAGRGLADE